ncbi:hypothetical protein NF699_04645 [Sphingomonadaceae bacterium OTU29LAMAA1]|uniref:hypothetical protein n=1 Tax=Sphingomonas sp. Leaf37 TaxID=2876552 RepID=UPI001E2ECE74|nr:hypothetical protein [Sphingomonas sp. Leaf37]USU05976.1 hypothetical protein NF699_04645 [Sphingomonadaceae bacterium OTU29LAMAA1]
MLVLSASIDRRSILAHRLGRQIVDRHCDPCRDLMHALTVHQAQGSREELKRLEASRVHDGGPFDEGET